MVQVASTVVAAAVVAVRATLRGALVVVGRRGEGLVLHAGPAAKVAGSRRSHSWHLFVVAQQRGGLTPAAALLYAAGLCVWCVCLSSHSLVLIKGCSFRTLGGAVAGVLGGRVALCVSAGMSLG